MTSSLTGTRSASAASTRSRRRWPESPSRRRGPSASAGFLRQLFNRTYGFTLDTLAKKPLKEALKTLRTYEAFASDYVTATVIQHALGGHAIPVDKPGQRALRRLGITEPEVPALRAVLERAVPKNRGAEFLDLIEDLTNDTCIEGEPDCPRCELKKICTFALNRKTESKASSRSSSSARAAKEAPATKAAKSKAGEKPATRPAAKKSRRRGRRRSSRGRGSRRGIRGEGAK